MRKISDSTREALMKDPTSRQCVRRLLREDHECEGRITWEHVFLYGGRQIDEPWAIVSLCEKAHSTGAWQDVGILDKELNEWLAMWKMRKVDRRRYERIDWERKRAYLEGRFGRIGTLYKK